MQQYLKPTDWKPGMKHAGMFGLVVKAVGVPVGEGDRAAVLVEYDDGIVYMRSVNTEYVMEVPEPEPVVEKAYSWGACSSRLTTSSSRQRILLRCWSLSRSYANSGIASTR